MRAQLTTISTRRSGSVARRVETLEAEAIRIGRAMGNEITLEGLSVALRHGDLVRRADGVYAVPHPPAPLLRRGRRIEGDVRLEPGDTLGVGPHELKVTAIGEDGFDVCLEIQVVKGQREDSPLDDASALLIERGMLSRRRLSGIAVAAVIVGALLWPLLLDWKSGWSSGPISNNHASIADDCSKCHQPFRPVANDLCLECHANLGSHVEDHPGFRDIDGLRCASCHMEHGGAEGLAALEDASCSSCHGNLGRHYPEARIPDASDFGADHPEFTLHMLQPGPEGDGASVRVERVMWSPEVQEESGLAFDHFAHVGGVRFPDGTRTNMRCNACHVVDEGGRRMAPIRYEEHCKSCHTLNFSVSGSATDPGRRTRKEQAVAPHGEPGELRRQLRLEILDAALTRRPGETQSERELRRLRFSRPGTARTPEEKRLLEAVDGRTEDAFAQLMSDEKGCGECHTLLPENGDRGRGEHLYEDVAPVVLTRAWFGPTGFDHSSHAAEPCGRCHPRAALHDPEYAELSEDFAFDPDTAPGRPFALEPVEEARKRGIEPSESARDVLVLGRDSCRECHAGSRAMAPEVASGCVMCHPYHHPDRESIARRVESGSDR